MEQNNEIEIPQNPNYHQDNQNIVINIINQDMQPQAAVINQQNNQNIHEKYLIKEICFLLFCVGVEEVAILEYIQITGVNQIIPLGLLGSYPLYKLLKSIFDLKDIECQQQSIILIDSLLECLSVILICLYFTYQSFYFSYVCIPLFISLLLKLDQVKIEGNYQQKDFIYFCKIVGFIIYAAIWVQLLQFSLKIDFYIQMEWSSILWPFWVVFTLISLFTIYFLYETMKFTVISHKTQTYKRELLGHFIIFLILSLFIVGLFLTSLKVLDYFDDTSKIYKDSYSLIFCFIATPLITLLILIFMNVITETVQFILFYDEDFQDNQIPQNQVEQNIEREQREGQEQFEQQKYLGGLIKLNINQKKNPLYLQKQSATFFSKSIILNKCKKDSSQQSDSLKDFKLSIKKSISVDIQQEELRKISHASKNLLEPSNPTMETEHAENKLPISQIPLKFPIIFNSLRSEVINDHIKSDKLDQNNNQNLEINQNQEIHDIFSERNVNALHRKSQSFSHRQRDIDPNIKEKNLQFESPSQQEKEEEESKNTSVQNCLVCFENYPDTVFMNCGHGGICYECALLIWKNTQECYLCRQKVEQLYQLEYNKEKKDKIMKVISKTIHANSQQC